MEGKELGKAKSVEWEKESWKADITQHQDVL